jgi:hypothetical protein
MPLQSRQLGGMPWVNNTGLVIIDVDQRSASTSVCKGGAGNDD